MKDKYKRLISVKQKYKHLIEKLLQLGPDDWPKFKKELKPILIKKQKQHPLILYERLFQ